VIETLQVALCRKPMRSNFVANLFDHGVAGVNIEECRVGRESTLIDRPANSLGRMNDDGWESKPGVNGSENGRYPSNVMHDVSKIMSRVFPATAFSKGGGGTKINRCSQREAIRT